MREIKFRAWDKQEEQMIINEQNFIPLKVTNKGVLRLSPHHEENLWSMVDNNRFEIMQYTGFKDKNGKEVYEDDIILVLGIKKIVVEYGIQKVYEEFGEWEYMGYNIPVSYTDYPLPEKVEIEVIGNIYENPELLK